MSVPKSLREDIERVLAEDSALSWDAALTGITAENQKQKREHGKSAPATQKRATGRIRASNGTSKGKQKGGKK